MTINRILGLVGSLLTLCGAIGFGISYFAHWDEALTINHKALYYLKPTLLILAGYIVISISKYVKTKEK